MLNTGIAVWGIIAILETFNVFGVVFYLLQNQISIK